MNGWFEGYSNTGYLFGDASNSKLMNTGGELVDVYDSLRPYIQDEIGGVSPMLLKQHVASVLQDFLKATSVWKETYIYNVADGDRLYTVTPSNSAIMEIHSINTIRRVTGRKAAVLDGNTIVTPEVLDGDTVNFNTLQPQQEYATIQKSSWIVQMAQQATEDQYKGLEIQCAIRSARRATTLPERILSDWYDAIAGGVKHKLMIMPKKSWSDPQTSLYYRSMYENGVKQARIEQNRNGVHNDVLQFQIPIGYNF